MFPYVLRKNVNVSIQNRDLFEISFIRTFVLDFITHIFFHLVLSFIGTNGGPHVSC